MAGWFYYVQCWVVTDLFQNSHIKEEFKDFFFFTFWPNPFPNAFCKLIIYFYLDNWLQIVKIFDTSTHPTVCIHPIQVKLYSFQQMFRSANLMFSLIWHYTVPKHIFSLSSLRCMSIIVLSLTISVLGSSCNYLLILDLFSRLFNVYLFLGIPSCIKKKAKEPERGRKRDNYCCTSVQNW